MEQEAINQRGGSQRGEGGTPAALWSGAAAGGAQHRETGSRSLLRAKAAVGADAGRTGRIVGAAIARDAGCDPGRGQKCYRELFKGEGEALGRRLRDQLRPRAGRDAPTVPPLIDGDMFLLKVGRHIGAVTAPRFKEGIDR